VKINFERINEIRKSKKIVMIFIGLRKISIFAPRFSGIFNTLSYGKA